MYNSKKIKQPATQICAGYEMIILGFLGRNHIPKLNITFSSEVLVSSHKRTYRNLAFHNVLARQGSSYYNRARFSINSISFCAP